MNCYSYVSVYPQGPRVSHKADFSSRSSGPEMTRFHTIGYGGGVAGGGGGGTYQDGIHMGCYQGTIRQQSRMDHDAMSLHSMRNTPAVSSWVDGSDAGSLVLGHDQDMAFNRQYAQSAVNGYTTQIKQGGSTMIHQAPMRRSLSGTLYQGGGMTGGVTEVIQQQSSFRGPAHRTINRITNRNNRYSMGSMSGQQISASAGSIAGDRVDGFIASTMPIHGSQGNLMIQRPGTLSRAMSIKSMHSVGKGVDVFGGQAYLGGSQGSLNG